MRRFHATFALVCERARRLAVRDGCQIERALAELDRLAQQLDAFRKTGSKR